MLPLLSRSVQDRPEELRARFAVGQPFRHIVIDEFLDAKFCDELVAAFPRFDERYAINERGEAGRKSANPNLAAVNPTYARFDSLIRSAEFLSLIGNITDIPNLLYDPAYVGGGTHENLDGQDLDCHVDFNYHPTTHTHRRLNLIVFLNPRWEPEWGGCLELLRDPWATGKQDRVTVVPLANRAVIFETTETSWHGFRRIHLPPGENLSRRSIAVYFYTRSHPESVVQAGHGTIYYQRPLPDRIRAGYRLTEEDEDEIRELLGRRDKQIQFLYKRELGFSKLIEGITGSPSFKLGRLLTWPLRAIRGRIDK